MRSRAVVAFGLAVSGVFIVAACASSDEAPPAQEAPAEEKPATIPAPTATADAAPPPKVCVATCKADSECANSCPTPTSGVACCDVKTGTCYTNASNTCPKVEEDDGGTPPAY